MNTTPPALWEANHRRRREGAERQIAAVREALQVLAATAVPGHLRDAGRLRLDFPHDSLEQLGQRCGVTKDAFAGRLRRLLKLARQVTS